MIKYFAHLVNGRSDGVVVITELPISLQKRCNDQILNGRAAKTSRAPPKLTKRNASAATSPGKLRGQFVRASFKNCPSLAIGLYVIPALTSGFLFVKPQMGSEAFRIEGLLFGIN